MNYQAQGDVISSKHHEGTFNEKQGEVQPQQMNSEFKIEQAKPKLSKKLIVIAITVLLLVLLTVGIALLVFNYFKPKKTITKVEVFSLKNGSKFVREEVRYQKRNWNGSNIDVLMNRYKITSKNGRLLTQADELSQDTLVVQTEPVKGMIIKKFAQSNLEISIYPDTFTFENSRLLQQNVNSALQSLKDELIGAFESQTDLQFTGEVQSIVTLALDTYTGQLTQVNQQKQPKYRPRRLFFGLIGGLISGIFGGGRGGGGQQQQAPSVTTTTSSTSTNSANTTTNIAAPVSVNTPVSVNVVSPQSPTPSSTPSQNGLGSSSGTGMVDMYNMMQIMKYCTIRNNGFGPIFDCPTRFESRSSSEYTQNRNQIIKLTAE